MPDERYQGTIERQAQPHASVLDILDKGSRNTQQRKEGKGRMGSCRLLKPQLMWAPCVLRLPIPACKLANRKINSLLVT